MSEVFEGYERQYCEISASLSRKCTAASALDGEKKKQKLSEIQSGVQEAESLIRKIDLEARSLQPSVKAGLLAKLREYKSDLNNIKSEIKRVSAPNVQQATREELLEAGMSDTLAVSSDERGRLMMTSERLNQSTDRIRESQRTVFETEEIGVSILQDLHNQRQSLLHAHTTAKGNDHIRASRGDQNPQRVAHPSSPLLMDSAPAAGAGEDPSPATAESSSSSGQQEDSQWLATLSEPELDLLISLKMLAVTRAKTAGHPHLAHLFDLRTLRALGVVLLESFKERLKETSVDPSILDRFAPLSDPDADFINSGSDSEVVKPNKDQSTPNIVKKKRKQM